MPSISPNCCHATNRISDSATQTRLTAIGGLDQVKRLIYFDAALVNSLIMQVFRISAGVPLRLCYGENG